MSEYAECPSCGQSKAKKVSFTWWGGMIGPGILNHVKCQACGTSYNGKTGNSNTVGIIVYSIVVAAIAIGLVVYINQL